MSHEIIIDSSLRGNKTEQYKSLLPQIRELVKDETDLTFNLSQSCAAFEHTMDRFVCVVFFLRQWSDLVLGPFQGPVACSRIKIPEGVCGAAASRKETIIVEDVNKFPGHIACSTLSKSEIVVPIFYESARLPELQRKQVIAVLDIDSESYSNFDNVDKAYLEELCSLVSGLMGKF